jgi:hypothetical protein
MSFLFFATSSDRNGNEIMQAIRAQFPDENVDICASPDSLALKLSEHCNYEKVAILVPADEDELIDIYSMQNLFKRVPVMLVLPKKDKFVEAMGYRLRPKLTIYKDSSIVQAVSKLHNMVESFQKVRVDTLPIAQK